VIQRILLATIALFLVGVLALGGILWSAHGAIDAEHAPLPTAQALADEGRRTNPFDLLVRPPAVFVKSLVLKLGFVDGWRGVRSSRVMAAHLQRLSLKAS
jgi:hypothetical protein